MLPSAKFLLASAFCLISLLSMTNLYAMELEEEDFSSTILVQVRSLDPLLDTRNGFIHTFIGTARRYCKQAVICISTGDVKRAIRFLTQVKKLYERSRICAGEYGIALGHLATAHTFRFKRYRREEDLKEAQRNFADCSTFIDRENSSLYPMFLFFRANLNYLINQDDLALRYCKESVNHPQADNVDKGLSWKLIGDILLKTQRQEAWEVYKKALEFKEFQARPEGETLISFLSDYPSGCRLLNELEIKYD